MAVALKKDQDLAVPKLIEGVERSKGFELAEQLKKTCTEQGEEKDVIESARIFHELGKLYQAREDETRFSFVKSAALFNAALLRFSLKNDTRQAQAIEEDLRNLCSFILDKAEA